MLRIWSWSSSASLSIRAADGSSKRGCLFHHGGHPNRTCALPAKFAKFSSDLPRYSSATGSRGRETIGSDGNKNLGAEEGTRTPTPLRVHGPEPCASANSATSASGCCSGSSGESPLVSQTSIFLRSANSCQTIAMNSVLSRPSRRHRRPFRHPSECARIAL